MSNICTSPNCKDRGEPMIDCNNGTLQCSTCKSRSCSIRDSPRFWYHCGKCGEFGVYEINIPLQCEYCGSDEVV